MISTQEQKIISQALSILKREMHSGEVITGNQIARNYIKLRLAGLEHESFAVLFLDTQHQVISFDVMFRGTIDQATVYPREVAKAALAHNAKAVIFAHNHPSDNPLASGGDKELTAKLIAALGLFDINVLDHFIVTKSKTFSFVERGLL